MKASTAQNPRTTPLILTNQDEIILHSMYQFRYMTAEDMAYLHYSPNSVAYVRRLLTRLAGAADLQPNSYLVRFNLPRVGPGNSRKIFALGIKGAKYLQKEAGVEVDWYLRVYKYRDLGFSQLRHQLLTTRFCVAASYWSRTQPQFTLRQTRLSYDLQRTTAKVIPDAWILFEDNRGKKYPIMLEIDRGMEYQQKFKRHVKARIEFIRSGAYAKVFGLKSVLVVYATTGQRPEYRDTRVAAMCAWIQEVCKELGKKTWTKNFRVTSLVLDESMYDHTLFEQPKWYMPGSATPVPLVNP